MSFLSWCVPYVRPLKAIRTMAIKRKQPLANTSRRLLRARVTRPDAVHGDPTNVQTLLLDLQRRLDLKSTMAYKQWLEKYLRHTTICRGAKMPAIRTCVNEWAAEHQLAKKQDSNMCKQLVFDLFMSDMNDDKIAATYIIHDVLQPSRMFHLEDLEILERLFRKDKICPWNVVDTLSARIFPSIIEEDKQPALDRLCQWSRAENMWQARTSVVALIHFSKDSAFHDVIFETSSVLIKREERFAKTCVGWIMREVAKADEEFARQFIDENLRFFSLEAVRNATKHFPCAVTSSYVTKIKQLGINE